MSVRYKGLTVIPIEPSLLQSFHTLMKKDELCHFNNWLDSDSEISFTNDHAKDRRDVPILEPESRGESGNYRMYPVDTDGGRKVALYWSGKTLPIMDFDASNTDIDYYISWLEEAIVEKKADSLKQKSYFVERKIVGHTHQIRMWIDLIEHARTYRNALVGWSWCSDSEILSEDGHVWIENYLPEDGLDWSFPDLDSIEPEGNIHRVADKIYFKETKVFNFHTSPEEAERLALESELQADFALSQYCVLGNKADYHFFIGKFVKAHYNRLCSQAKQDGIFDSTKSEYSRLKTEFKDSHRGKVEEFVEKMWKIASRKTYLNEYRKNGVYKTPDSLEKLLSNATLAGSVFHYLTHTLSGAETGAQYSEDCLRLKEECAVERINHGVFVHQKLLKHLPLESVQIGQTGVYEFRNKVQAWWHWDKDFTHEAKPAPLAIPRPNAVMPEGLAKLGYKENIDGSIYRVVPGSKNISAPIVLGKDESMLLKEQSQKEAREAKLREGFTSGADLIAMMKK